MKKEFKAILTKREDKIEIIVEKIMLKFWQEKPRHI